MTGRAIASGLSRHPDPAVAVAEVLGAIVESIDGEPDLAIAFVSGKAATAFDQILRTIVAVLSPRVVLGSTASGVLAGGEEAEGTDAVAVWAGRIGDVVPLRLDALPGAEQRIVGLPSRIEPGSTLVVLADPYTFPVDCLIDDVARHRVPHEPPVTVAGGLASLGSGLNRLAVGTGTSIGFHDDGAVAVVLPPGTVQPIVSQGCRPVGQPWTITASDGRLLLQLGGRPALDRVNEMIADMSPRDRLCASQGLHLGIAANEQTEQFDRGDFLIRGVLGADRNTGAVAVGALIEVGQTVQLQVRDAESAHEDLVLLLQGSLSEVGAPQGALLFTCNGRGTRLFAEPNHDASMLNELTNGRGVAGMFCAGELGPIGPVNAVHGFTATVLLFPATVQGLSCIDPRGTT